MGIYYQKVLTKKLSPVVSASRVHYLTRPFYSGSGSILMFHRVIPPGKKYRIHNHLGLEISPDHLEKTIGFFKKQHYHFIKLDNLADWLIENRTTRNRFVIFTFDDGYKDNLDYAYPVFKKHQIPFTIYVTTLFPEKKAVFWWYVIEDILRNNDRLVYNFSSAAFNLRCDTINQKENAFMHLRKHITSLDQTKLSEELTGFFNKYGFDLYAHNESLPLTWNEIAELAREKLVTIGSHTTNHYNLLNLSDTLAWEEIAGSKRRLESVTGKQVDQFCYPLGLYGERETGYVKKNGYASATTTKTANIFPDHAGHLFNLPRIAVNSLTTGNVLSLHINGFFPAVLNKFKQIVV